MKSFFISLILFSFSSKAYCQTNSTDGKMFIINYYEDGVFDSDDTLFFQSGMLNFATATLYGFQQAEYKSKEKDSTVTIFATNKSKLNGTMFWSVMIKEDKIEGTCTFDRPNENPVNFTIKGKEIKQ